MLFLGRQIYFLLIKEHFFKALVESKFKYCPTVWIFLSRRNKNKINILQKIAL